MSKFYADKFYKDQNGNYYTGEYLKKQFNIDHDGAAERGYTWVSFSNGMTWDEFHNEMTGKTVRCNYSQIFNPDSQMVLCNNVPTVFPEIWDYLENGDTYDEENGEYNEIFQWYIIDDNTAERLKEHTDEIIFYWPEADLYILGVTHWGTSWGYVSADFVY